MNYFKLAFRSLLRKRRHNAIKILSLTMGLLVGGLLLAKVFFMNSYDNFFPEKENLYQVVMYYSFGEDDKESSLSYTSGGIAPGMRDNLPEVVAATRATLLNMNFSKEKFFTEEKDLLAGGVAFVDEYFFDLLPRPMLSGNAKELLSRPMYCLIAESIAEKISGNPIGKTIEFKSYPGKKITIGGVFKDYPQNSQLAIATVLVSMNSLGNFRYDGSDNLFGNEAYLSVVKLAKGTNPDNLREKFRAMQVKKQNIEELEKQYGVKFYFTLSPYSSMVSSMPEVKRMTMILSIIAFVLLLSALMNYVLVFLSSMLERIKTSSIHKCYGAKASNIRQMIFSEIILHFILALGAVVLLVLLFGSTIEELIDQSIVSLLIFPVVLPLLAILLLIVLILSECTTRITAKIPVLAVFRYQAKSNKFWKMILLSSQILFTCFLASLSLIIFLQYRYMLDDYPGYSTEKLYYSDVKTIDKVELERCRKELEALPFVGKTSISTSLLFYGGSGNNVSRAEGDEQWFNFSDLYFCDSYFMPMLDISIIEGEGFSEEHSLRNDMIISKLFAEKLIGFTDWSDGVVGKTVYLSEHGNCRIVGIMHDLRIGTIINQDFRPSVLFFADETNNKRCNVLNISLTTESNENLRQITDIMNRYSRIPDIEVKSYNDAILRQYESARIFRNTVIAGCLITLLIALVGLLGYVNNEVIRRRKEIAIRKINGATERDIIKIFVKGMIVWLAVAVFLGGFISRFVAEKWMENFSKTISLSATIFIVSGTVVLFIALAVVVLNCLKVSRENPAIAIKQE